MASRKEGNGEKVRKDGWNTNLLLATAHLPALVLLPLPHVLEKQTASTLLGVLAPFDHRVRARVPRGKAEEFAVVAASRVVVFAVGGAGVE